LGNLLTEQAVDLLYSHLHAIPSSEFGHLNLVPFATEGEQTNSIKKEVAKGIVDIFATNGYPMDPGAKTPEISRQIRVLCRSCGTVLFSGTTDHNGGITVAAPALLSTLARLRAECPHSAFTPEDQRAFIEEAVK